MPPAACLLAVRQRARRHCEHSSDETQQPRVTRLSADDLAYAACLTHIFQRSMGCGNQVIMMAC